MTNPTERFSNRVDTYVRARPSYPPAAMHLTKMAVYQRFALIGLLELQYGLFLGLGMVLGSWTGKRLIERLPQATFRAAVELLLILSGLQLLMFA